MAFFSAFGRGAASVMSMTVMLEEFLEAVTKSFMILFFLFNNFLDLQQVVLMFDFFFAILAKTELRTSWTLISDTNDWL